jgi:hypothetical protein
VHMSVLILLAMMIARCMMASPLWITHNIYKPTITGPDGKPYNVNEIVAHDEALAINQARATAIYLLYILEREPQRVIEFAPCARTARATTRTLSVKWRRALMAPPTPVLVSPTAFHSYLRALRPGRTANSLRVLSQTAIGRSSSSIASTLLSASPSTSPISETRHR